MPVKNLITECNKIEQVTQWADKDTGVFIDFDNTLIEACTALGHSEWYYGMVQKAAQEGIPFADFVRKFYMDWVYIQEHCKNKPVEETTLPTVEALKKISTCVMILTHRQYTTVAMTLRQMQPLRLSFKDSSPLKHTFTLREPFPFPVSHSEGIIFVGDYNLKSEVLGWFIRKLGCKKILFIDDRLGHVNDVHNWCCKEKIDSVCVHYRAIEVNQPRIYSPEIAEIQLREFDRTGKIIDNSEALKLLK